LICKKNICFRIIDLPFDKRELSQTYKQALGRHQPRGRPLLLTAAQVEFLPMTIEDRFNRKRPITYFGLLYEMEMEFGIALLTNTLRHIT
jgi:hypothetical protein